MTEGTLSILAESLSLSLPPRLTIHPPHPLPVCLQSEICRNEVGALDPSAGSPPASLFLPRSPHQSAAEDSSASPFDRRTLLNRCAAGLLGTAAVVVGGGGAFAAEMGTTQSPIAVVGAGGK